MSLAIQTLGIEQGADWAEQFTFASPDPSGLNQWDQMVYYNFTGAAVRLQVRQSFDNTSLQLFVLSVGAGVTLQSVGIPDGPAAPAFNNTIAVSIPAAQSLTVPAGEYWYDMFVDWGSGGTGGAGTHTRMLSGNFQVIQTITR
jgi:hypothetical protein